MKYIYTLALLFICSDSFSQNKSISLAKKITDPYVTQTNDTVRIDDQVVLQLGSNQDGSFKYVQLLNGFNEPIKPADSRQAMKKQKVSFFKEQDGTTYLFTKFYVINIEAALMTKEIKLK